MFIISLLVTMSIHFSFHRGPLGQQSWHDAQALHATEDMGVRITLSTGGRHSPLPSCNVTHGVLYTMASPVVPHWTGTPAARGLPEARLMKSGTSTSLTAVAPERSITRVLHRVVTAGQPTGRSLSPCDEPSAQGCSSSVMPTPEHRRTPETAGQSAVPHAPVKSSVHHHTRSCKIGNPESLAVTVET